MPKKEDWVLLQKSDFASFDAFKDYMHNRYKFKIGKNNSQKCSKCDYDCNLHMRRYILGSCGGLLCNKDKPCLVSLNLIQRIEQLGKLHLDGTYRIIICAFPVIVLGLSDINRKFYPVAYMITSHEKH